ncbi:MAG: 5'/3'-nucleotidase SurE [Anaerolineae bacterium]|nr:5'/3'-nucleotidase SurE [Anaerolineae bacterium]
MPHIFVTNDDGVQAAGLLALVQALKTLGTVQIVAPAVNQSAVGHKKTLFQDIPMHETVLADGTPAYAVGGSPADCIAISALGATPWPPDLVVSGINRGPNMAQDITYSGTVTAAFESVIHGVPAIAVSLDNHRADNVEDYRPAAAIAVRIAARVLEKGLPPLTILNLNVPDGHTVRGLRLTRQGIRIYRDALSRDGNIFQIVGEVPTGVYNQEGTDLWAVHNGYASLTPLHLDLTAHRFIADLAAWDITLQDS